MSRNRDRYGRELKPEKVYATCGRCGGSGDDWEEEIVASGDGIEVRMPVKVTCGACGGSGQIRIQ